MEAIQDELPVPPLNMANFKNCFRSEAIWLPISPSLFLWITRRALEGEIVLQRTFPFWKTNSNPEYIKGFRTNIASFLAIKETNSGVNKLTYIFHFLKDDDIIKIISAPLSTTTQEVVKIYINTLLNFDKQKYDEFSTGNKKVLFSEFKNWNGNSIESLLKDDYEFSQLIKSTVDTFWFAINYKK